MSTALIANISPSLRDALSARRDDLNRRFARAQHRWPKLDGARVLLEFAELVSSLALPPTDAPSLADLIATAFDLVMLHSARDAFSTKPALRELLVAALGNTALRRLCLQRPTQLLPALSNAVEQLADRGSSFVARLLAMAKVEPDAGALLSAGAVAAWTLGEPRLREAALANAATLSTALWAAAFGDERIDPQLTAAALAREGWQRVTQSTPAWHVVARLGGFTGFDGAFVEPPLLVTTGVEDVSDRHHVHVRCGDQIFSVTADVFGARIRLAPSLSSSDVQPALTPASRASGKLPFQLTRGGVLTVGGAIVTVPELAGATSYLGRDRLVFVTLADSHRIRVVALT